LIYWHIGSSEKVADMTVNQNGALEGFRLNDHSQPDTLISPQDVAGKTVVFIHTHLELKGVTLLP
jgi:hypothetical protein